MKKIHFFAMALAALTIISCSKEDVGGDNNGQVVEGVETYATFSFNIEGSGVKTRAADDSETDETGGTVATDDNDIRDIRIAVFNDKGILEATATNAANTPIKLTSGIKKIFVFANSESTVNFPALKVDETTLKNCYASGISLMKGGVFSIMDLVSKTNGYYMSSARTANSTQTLAPGITAEQSKNEGFPNHFTFNVQRAVSKVKAKLENADVLTIGDKAAPTATLKEMFYTVRNINNSVAPVQLFTVENIADTKEAMEAGTPMSAFYNKFDAWTTTLDGIPAKPDEETTAKENFYSYYDRSFKMDQSLTEVESTKNVFVTENTNAKQVIGNTSYLAIKGVYTPKKVVSECVYDSDFNGGSFTTITESDGVGAANFWKVDLVGLGKIGGVAKPLTNNLFEEKTLAESILEAVLTANGYSKDGSKDKEGGTITGETEKTAAVKAFNAEFDKRLLEYTGGVTYYRLNIGRSSKLKTTFGIRRNSRYDITINKISKLGVNTDDKLDDNPETPVTSQETFVTATIVVSEWNDYIQDGDL